MTILDVLIFFTSFSRTFEEDRKASCSTISAQAAFQQASVIFTQNFSSHHHGFSSLLVSSLSTKSRLQSCARPLLLDQLPDILHVVACRSHSGAHSCLRQCWKGRPPSPRLFSKSAFFSGNLSLLGSSSGTWSSASAISSSSTSICRRSSVSSLLTSALLLLLELGVIVCRIESSTSFMISMRRTRRSRSSTVPSSSISPSWSPRVKAIILLFLRRAHQCRTYQSLFIAILFQLQLSIAPCLRGSGPQIVSPAFRPVSPIWSSPMGSCAPCPSTVPKLDLARFDASRHTPPSQVHPNSCDLVVVELGLVCWAAVHRHRPWCPLGSSPSSEVVIFGSRLLWSPGWNRSNWSYPRPQLWFDLLVEGLLEWWARHSSGTWRVHCIVAPSLKSESHCFAPSPLAMATCPSCCKDDSSHWSSSPPPTSFHPIQQLVAWRWLSSSWAWQWPHDVLPVPDATSPQEELLHGESLEVGTVAAPRPHTPCHHPSATFQGGP